MSRVGKKPVEVPGGVTVKVVGREISVAGPKGSSQWTHPATAQVRYDDGTRQITVTSGSPSKQARANFGLTRALIANMVTGVTAGFERRLQIYGTGYNCKCEGGKLRLNIGFSGRGKNRPAQFEIPVPKGVEVVIEREAARGDTEPAQLVVRGIDKRAVGEFAAEIRALKRTEPYKGKGIRYAGEYIKKKQGKALTGSS